MATPITVVSLGTTVLDDIHLSTGQAIPSVPGGSALFATLGARVAAPLDHASRIGCLVVGGVDLPDSLTERLRDWGVTLHLSLREGSKVARGRLRYLDPTGDAKTFEYITPPLRASADDLAGSALLQAGAFHLLGPPDYISRLVPDVVAARGRHGVHSRPLFVWEPAPATCTAEHYDAHLAAAKLVDVISPNHKELDALHGRDGGDSSSAQDADADAERVVALAQTICLDGIGPDGQGLIVVRCGPRGAVVVGRNMPPDWYPAYYNSRLGRPGERGPGEVDDAGVHKSTGRKALVDCTGAGNAFLGGFITGWQLGNGHLMEACVRGAVGASFAMEQVGMPVRSVVGGEELWNGKSAQERLARFRAWVGAWKQQQGGLF